MPPVAVSAAGPWMCIAVAALDNPVKVSAYLAVLLSDRSVMSSEPVAALVGDVGFTLAAFSAAAKWSTAGTSVELSQAVASPTIPAATHSRYRIAQSPCLKAN